MSNIVTHLGVDKKWDAYRNGHNSFTLTFTNSGAFDTSSYTFVCNIRQRGSSTNLLQLTQGSGITNGGATGIVTVTLTKSQIETYLPGSDYFYEIKYTVSDNEYALLQGGLALHSQSNPGTSTTSVTIPVSLAGTAVSVAASVVGAYDNSDIDGGSASSTYLGDQNIDGGTA